MLIYIPKHEVIFDFHTVISDVIILILHYTKHCFLLRQSICLISEHKLLFHMHIYKSWQDIKDKLNYQDFQSLFAADRIVSTSTLLFNSMFQTYFTFSILSFYMILFSPWRQRMQYHETKMFTNIGWKSNLVKGLFIEKISFSICSSY